MALDSLFIKRYSVNHPVLKNLIKYYWVMQSQSPTQISHKLLPVSNIDLVINLSSPISYIKNEEAEIVPVGVHFNGIRDRHYLIKQTGKISVLGISFFPLGIFPILKIPMSEFKDKTIEVDVAVHHFTETIMNKINIAQPIQEIIDIIEEQLVQNIDLSLIPGKEILNIYEVYKENIFESNIHCFCEKYGINPRTLERVFNKYVGISPKSFSKIIRFEKVIKSMGKMNKNSFTDITYDNNYYDQTHFIKDFKLFTGSTPAEFLNQKQSVKQIIKYH